MDAMYISMHYSTCYSLKSAESEAALFYEKLKDAELALKRQLQEAASQRQQAAADQEVISYLDLAVT